MEKKIVMICLLALAVLLNATVQSAYGQNEVVGVTIVDYSSYCWEGQQENYAPVHLVNGSGLSSDLHGTNQNFAMWLIEYSACGSDSESPDTVEGEYVTFDLGELIDLESTKIWNWNGATFPGVCVHKMKIWVAGDGVDPSDPASFQLHNPNDPNIILTQNPCTGGAAGEMLSLDTSISVRYVKFEVIENYGHEAVGLSEVKFYGLPPTPSEPIVIITETDDLTLVDEQKDDPDTYRVVLGYPPTSPVTISIDYDQTQIEVIPNELVFETSDWQTPQTVTVTAVSDGIDEGMQNSIISHSADGGNYTGIAIDEVIVKIIDPATPVVYVLVTTHFDWPFNINTSHLNALRNLSIRHPKMKWTHLYNPVVYTQTSPYLAEIEDYIFESRDVYGAEIGLHLHMFKSFVEAAGVSFRDSPSLNGDNVPGCGSDTGGYSVPFTAYTSEEIGTMIDFSIAKFGSRGLDRPRTFCAGYWATSITSQTVVSEKGFTVSKSALPPGTEYGSSDMTSLCWLMYSGWGDETVTHTTSPYMISSSSILPAGGPPYLWTDEGPMLEFPQNCKVGWMIPTQGLKDIFLDNYNLATPNEPKVIDLVLHDSTAVSQYAKFDDTLSFIDQYVENPDDVLVVYATANEVHKAILPKFILGGDTDRDGDVDFEDLFVQVTHWLDMDCVNSNDWCNGADSNRQGSIDLEDFVILSQNWLTKIAVEQ